MNWNFTLVYARGQGWGRGGDLVFSGDIVSVQKWKIGEMGDVFVERKAPSASTLGDESAEVGGGAAEMAHPALRPPWLCFPPG